MFLPQFPEYEITIKLFKNCPQESFPPIDAAFGIIDASKVYSTNVLYSAIYKALVESKYNRMRTKNLNSEVILSLFASTNIGEAFKQIGLNKNTTQHIITLSIINKSETQDQVDQDIQGGELHEFSDENLASIRDIQSIKSIYKINDTEKLNELELEGLIVNAVQLRGL